VVECDDQTYPRVLIFGGGFDSYSGTGITLSNLFEGWPSDRLAVADSTAGDRTAAMACAEYRLGTLEQRWRWPLSHVPRHSEPSGSVDYSKRARDSVIGGNRLVDASAPSMRAGGVRARVAFRQVVNWAGAEDILQRSVLSAPLRKWVADFSPQVLYCLFSTLGTIRLVRALHEYAGARLAIHIMDDWPNTVYGGTLLGPALRSVVDSELRELLARAEVRMAISRAMADEYLARYGCGFEVFHNCVDVPLWRKSRKVSWAVGSPLSVVYSGRIGWDALTSFRDACEAIELMNQSGLPTQFRIYTPTPEKAGAARLGDYGHTVMLPSVEGEHLSRVLSGADLLIIPSDFHGRGRQFSRLSMPTKVPAYMACGTPIVLYSPRTHAMCAWAEQAHWAFVVGERSPQLLAQALTDLAASAAVREALGRKASQIADRELDGRQVRTAFRDTLAGR